VKGFLSFSTLALTLVPPKMTIPDARALYLEISFGIVFTKFIAYFDVVDVSLARKFTLIPENF
jgi:hypothetical protein